MKLRQIEIFCAVMRSRTTVAAAFELGISQPAVSAAIKHMEVQTGLKLFERLGNRLVPTHEATALYRDTGPLQAMAEALAVKVRDLRHSRGGHLRILSTHAMKAVATRALAAFLAPRPHVRVYVEVERTEVIVELIESGFADLGLTIAPPPRPGLASERITGGAMVVALPPGHRLLRAPALTADDLRRERLIGIESTARLGGMVRQAFEAAGIEYRPTIEVRHGTTARALVEQGLGLAVIDPFSAHENTPETLETRPFHPRIEIEGCAIRLEAWPLSRLASRYMAELREVAGAIQGDAPARGQPRPLPSGLQARPRSA